MNQVTADFQKLNKILHVIVSDSFAGSIGEELPDLFASVRPTDEMVDIRWKGVYAKDEQDRTTPAKIVIDRWHVGPMMKKRLSDLMTRYDDYSYQPFVLGQSPDYRFICSEPIELIFNANIGLAIIAHFGFEAEYDPEFMKMMAPIFDHCFLHAWIDEKDSANTIRNRLIAGEAIPRPEFIRRFDQFLVKYGM